MDEECIENKINILLVDDRPDGLVALEAVLKSPRYKTFLASSGMEALGIVFDHDFAAIVMDVQMPGMDGFETGQIIRQRERSRKTPILFVTAINKTPHHISRGYELGGVDYIFKPFDPSILQAKVSVFADLYETHRELLQKSEKLKKSEERNRLLLDTANDIIATCDLNGSITSLSPAFEVILGKKRDDWMEKSISLLVHPQDVSSVEKIFESSRKHSEAYLGEARFKTNFGDDVVLEYSVKPLVECGAVTGTLTVARDISERVRAEKERRQRYELERVNKELEQFAYICSHDLQEPLRTMGTCTQLLERRMKDRLGSQETELLTYITDGAKRMSRLVGDILDFSRFGSNVVLEPVATDAAYLEAVDILNARLVESKTTLEVSDLPKVSGVYSELVRLFQNLIANAIKFKSALPLKISISATIQEGEWVFAVKDNGIGFKMEYAQQIFQIFKRLHTGEKYAGTGMGLAICKKIVERHGGRIWAESSPSQGATFFFTIPVAERKTSTANRGFSEAVGIATGS